MAKPLLTTVTIDGDKFNAISAHVGISTAHDHSGMPMMGSLSCSIEVIVDIHDNVNMPFATLHKLFDLANGVTRDKIKDVKIEFWQDERQQDAICTYNFKGWISNFRTISGHGENHLQELSIQPALDTKNYIDLKMGN
jgi:hypothetical protein